MCPGECSVATTSSDPSSETATSPVCAMLGSTITESTSTGVGPLTSQIMIALPRAPSRVPHVDVYAVFPRTDSSALNRAAYVPWPVTRIAVVPMTGRPVVGAPFVATHDGSRRGPEESPHAAARTEATVVASTDRRYDVRSGMK